MAERIRLVEDHPDRLSFGAEILEHAGDQVIQADSGLKSAPSA